MKSIFATLFQPCLGCLKPPEAVEGSKEGSLAERNLVADCVERGGDVCDNEGGMRMRGNVCMTVKYCSDSPDGQAGRKRGER